MARPTIPDILINALDDGKWHSLNELTTKQGLRNVSMTTLKFSLTLLAEYDFTELREEWKGESLLLEAKLNPHMLTFLRRIKWIERSEEP